MTTTTLEIDEDEPVAGVIPAFDVAALIDQYDAAWKRIRSPLRSADQPFAPTACQTREQVQVEKVRAALDRIEEKGWSKTLGNVRNVSNLSTARVAEIVKDLGVELDAPRHRPRRPYSELIPATIIELAAEGVPISANQVHRRIGGQHGLIRKWMIEHGYIKPKA